MKNLYCKTILTAIILSALCVKANAQKLEWRLVSQTYSAVDPDGAGPARGSATFTLQIHTISGQVSNVNTITLGWSYQSASTMIPTTPACNIVSNPANVSVSAAFAAGGFAYTTVNQCNTFSQTTGGQTFDKRVSGTLDGNSINITTAWTDVFTITLWTLGSTAPEGGYVILNSGSGGTPAPFSTYAVSDVNSVEYAVNSTTYTTPLAVTSALPITLSKFNAACTGSGSLLSWQTLTEINNDHFEIEKSSDGITGWNVISTVKGAGNSTAAKQYQFTDATAGGTSYYRLKQVDIDGKFTYSSVEKTDCQNKALQFVVYPVPAKDVLNVVLSAERNSTATIKLTDIAGRVYKAQKTDILKGSNKIVLNVANLITGQYILQIEKDNEVQTKVVMIK